MTLIWTYSGIFAMLSKECEVLEKGSRTYLADTVIEKGL